MSFRVYPTLSTHYRTVGPRMYEGGQPNIFCRIVSGCSASTSGSSVTRAANGTRWMRPMSNIAHFPRVREILGGAGCLGGAAKLELMKPFAIGSTAPIFGKRCWPLAQIGARSLKTRGWMRRHHPKHEKPKKIKAKPSRTLSRRFILVHDEDPVTRNKKPVLLHWAANRRHNRTKKSYRSLKNLKGLRPLKNKAYVRKVIRLGFRGDTLKHMIPQHKGEIDYILRKLRERGRVH